MSRYDTTAPDRWVYQHRPGCALCLCKDCVARHTLKYAKEPNTQYPDCDNCYLQWNDVAGEYCNYFCPVHPDPALRVQIENKKNPRRAEEGTEYAFTLTMPPDYQPVKPLLEVAQKIIEHGLTSKPYEKANKYAYVLEHTEAGTPHIHGVYSTPSGRRISSKYFKRYWPLWDEKVPLGHGHKGGYHQKARHTESYAAYLQKEGTVITNVQRTELNAERAKPEESAEPSLSDEEVLWEDFNDPRFMRVMPRQIQLFDVGEDADFISYS